MAIAGVALAADNAAGGTIEVRLDSLSGPLVGTTEAMGAKGDKALDRRRVPVPATPGVHDLYLVFRNERATRGQLLLYVTTATFERP